MYTLGDGALDFASIRSNDTSSRQIHVVWNADAQEHGQHPVALVLNSWFSPKPKPRALSDVAARLLDPELVGGPVSRVGERLLRRELPLFAAGYGPRDGTFGSDLLEITGWAPHLDESYAVIQGPPGTGKTYTGAHIVHELVRSGRRVGITAMSHAAVGNLLRQIFDVFDHFGDTGRLSAVRKVPDSGYAPIRTAENTTSNSECAKREYNVVAGTTWLFAGNDMRQSPVDVLIVDEAGQLGLADALAASTSAHSMILLGDPLQLPQVSQATHPGGSGASVLEHVLGEHPTVPSERGVFLPETRRMHPDVCTFISEQIYEGRLWSHPSCSAQTVEGASGLRWLRASHESRSRESPEEAFIVVEAITDLLGKPWTAADGSTRPLAAADVLVVAPYNDQVDLLRATLDASSATHGVRVGTVDKFQGQEAPVVFFSMTSSSAADMPRGPDFLFSRNRLNVAISRARALAHVVCTEELLDSRASDIDTMRLISTLCSFVEYAEGQFAERGMRSTKLKVWGG